MWFRCLTCRLIFQGDPNAPPCGHKLQAPVVTSRRRRFAKAASDYARVRRRLAVRDGKCSQCYRPRDSELFASLCSGCARKHRERQRAKCHSREVVA